MKKREVNLASKLHVVSVSFIYNLKKLWYRTCQMIVECTKIHENKADIIFTAKEELQSDNIVKGRSKSNGKEILKYHNRLDLPSK